MKAKRIYAILLRQYFLIRANPTRFVQYFLWAALDIILWGFITKYLSGVADAGFSLVATLLGAVMLWDFLTRVMQGITTAFFEDVWSRNFLNLFASPLLMAEYILGLVGTSIGTSTAGFVAMLILGIVLFGFSLFSYGIALLPFVLILFLFGIALGIFGVALVLRLGPSAEWFIWPIPTVLSPFVGVFYPIAVLPHWMQVVSYFLPPSYVFEGMRGVVLHGTFSASSLLFGAVFAFLYIALAYWFFISVYRHVVKTGLIARYSAENVF